MERARDERHQRGPSQSETRCRGCMLPLDRLLAEAGDLFHPTCSGHRHHEAPTYIESTGMAEYRATPGNQGAWMLARDLGDGRTEIVTLSFWASRDVIRAFDGDDSEQAVFYP